MNQERLSILLVDADRSYSDEIRSSLGIYGDTYCFDSPESAIDFMHGVPIDLIVMDIELPGMGGLEFLDIIKSQTKHSHIPVAIITNLDDFKISQSAASLGADLYMIKKATSADEVASKIISVI